MNVQEAIVAAFVKEGTDAVFGLMGDGNMFWMSRMGKEPSVRLIHARHENAAVAMADGYARVTGRVGVASVTCGPGITQIGTSLTASVRHRTPLVIFAGDTPYGSAFHLQQFEQEPYVRSCGAGFVSAHRPERALDDVALAFYMAQHERRPVVLAVPYDLQDAEYPWEVDPRGSRSMLPGSQRSLPDPQVVSEIAAILAQAKRPVILAGRGSVASGAKEEILKLATRTGALLATSLRAKGWFDGEEFNTGICGAFATAGARALLAEADCVVGVGARLGYFTTEAGYMFPEAEVIQIDSEPIGYIDGQRVADVMVTGDAALTIEAIHGELARKGHQAVGYRTPEVAQRIADDIPDEPEFPLDPGTMDPRTAITEIDDNAPKDWRVVIGAGHFWNFAVPGFTGRDPNSYLFTYDFGVIGQGLPTALGAAVAEPDRPVVLIEGDGSILMNIQEFECMARQQIPVLACIIDDGAYGAEVHKMRSKGFVDDESIFGFPDLEAIAAAFGIRSYCVTEAGALPAIIDEFKRDPKPTLVDIRVSTTVMSRTYRRLFFGQKEA